MPTLISLIVDKLSSLGHNSITASNNICTSSSQYNLQKTINNNWHVSYTKLFLHILKVCAPWVHVKTYLSEDPLGLWNNETSFNLRSCKAVSYWHYNTPGKYYSKINDNCPDSHRHIYSDGISFRETMDIQCSGYLATWYENIMR